MEIVCHIVELVLNNLEVYLLIKWLEVFLIKKSRGKEKIVAFLLLVGLTHIKSICDWWFSSSNESTVLAILLMFAYFVMAIYLFYGSDEKKILLCIAYIVMQMITEVIWSILVAMFANGMSLSSMIHTYHYRLYGNLITKVLLCIIILSIQRYSKRKNGLDMNIRKDKVILVMINFMLCFSLFIIYNKREQLTENVMFILIGCSFLCVIVVSIFYYKNAIDEMKRTMEEELELQNMQQKLKQNDDIRVIVDNLRSLRHDMNNHMMVISGLLDLGQIEELKKYVAEFRQELEKATNFIILENETLAIILNYKAEIAKQKGIKFESCIALSQLDLEDMEICSVFGNILDNAIEANEGTQCREPFINLAIEENREGVSITCSNTYMIEPVIEDNIIITTKEDKGIHGIGTRNVKNIVEKYHGILEYHTEQNIFSVHIYLPKRVESN
ncbi:sensor histidine kinase [Lachnospiraceae bacterium KM106-2]|nr:sensor histidine kinase [Lachnospiraceae bacterium KM106-2]